MTMQGWECPKCGVVYAPSVQSCACSVNVLAPRPLIPPLRPQWWQEPHLGERTRPLRWEREQFMCVAGGVA